MKSYFTLFYYLAIAYVVAACMIFQIRHPWATNMETIMNIGHALTFSKVPYDEMRYRK